MAKRAPQKKAPAKVAPAHNAEAIAGLEEMIALVKKAPAKVVGLAVAVAFDTSEVGTRYLGEDNTRLLGALSVLEGRVRKVFE